MVGEVELVGLSIGGRGCDGATGKEEEKEWIYNT